MRLLSTPSWQYSALLLLLAPSTSAFLTKKKAISPKAFPSAPISPLRRLPSFLSSKKSNSNSNSNSSSSTSTVEQQESNSIDSTEVSSRIATSTTSSTISKTALKGLDNCASATQARRLLQKELVDKKKHNAEEIIYYQSISIPPGASARGISDGDLAIQTRLVNKKYQIMDLIELTGDRDADRASFGILSLMVGCTSSAIVANQSLPGPEILRFIVVWLLSFAPLAFVGYGIADAEKLQGILLSIQRSVFPAYRKRMVQHEAGHFLMSHLLGWPIAGYRANAIKNAVEFYPLSDADRGKDYANQLGFDSPAKNRNEQNAGSRGGRGRGASNTIDNNDDAPFFSKQGRGGETVEELSVFRKDKNYTDNPFLKLPSQNEPSEAWPYRGFDDSTLDQLAVISLAGVCAEILAFGNAEGGAADLGQLRQIFNSAQEEMTDRDVDNRIRYALGYTMSQLRRHLGALDALADAMEKDATVAECVMAIETCKNPSGQDGILRGDYEVRRRQAFKTEGVSWIERTILGGNRDIDAVEDRMVEGKGGGYRKETFRLTGDDPLYLALAAAFAFFVWASSGGLSLH